MENKQLTSKDIIKKIENKGKEIRKFNVKKIGLFGSYVKNKQHKKSDIDILVTFEKETFDNYMDLLFLLEKEFGRQIDLTIEKDLHPKLEYVKKEARYVRL
jgi:predicted nucleotidyltransferase